jgi:putative flippase GtrA
VRVVIPTRDEAESIVDLLGALDITAIDMLPWNVDLSVLVVDDSDEHTQEKGFNTAHTARTLEEHMAVTDYKRLSSVTCHYRPKGRKRWGRLAGAVVDGYRLTDSNEFEFVLVMDGDGQHPPKAIIDMILRLLESDNPDVVVASRFHRDGSANGLSRARRIISRTLIAYVKILFPLALRGVGDPMSGCFGVRRNKIDTRLLTKVNFFKILLELLVTHKLNVAEIGLQFANRETGESKADRQHAIALFKQTIRLRSGGAFVRFCAVGFTTYIATVIGEASFSGIGINTYAAYAMAVVVATALNLRLNRAYTFPNNRALPRWKVLLYFVLRTGVMTLNWAVYTSLMVSGWGTIAAISTATVVSTGASFPLTKLLLENTQRQPKNHPSRVTLYTYQPKLA